MRDAAHESVAVGFFDGVHIGHQAILCGAASAITFRNHPLSVLAPERAPRLIMSFEDRLAAIRACGVKDVVALDFTEALAREAPEDFMRRLGPCVRCGENWRFGARGAGDADFLRAHGVAVEVVPYAEYRGERVSSTRIRAALESGAIADANAMLGRPFAVSGLVFHGKGEGRALGFPTVNLHLEMAIRLPFGVYVVEVERVEGRGERVVGERVVGSWLVGGGERVERVERGVRGIANYGLAPTMGERAWNEPCLEVHFLNGERVEGRGERVDTHHSSLITHHLQERVAFLDFIRPERTFGSKEELAEQIAADIVSMGGKP